MPLARGNRTVDDSPSSRQAWVHTRRLEEGGFRMQTRLSAKSRPRVGLGGAKVVTYLIHCKT